MNRTDTIALPFPIRATLAHESLVMQSETRPNGQLTDSDVLNAAEAWTTSNLDTIDLNAVEDYDALRDTLFAALTRTPSGVHSGVPDGSNFWAYTSLSA